MKKIITTIFLFISFKSYSQHLDWNKILGSYDSTNNVIYYRLHGIALDEFGNPYYSTYEKPTMLSSPYTYFFKDDNIYGLGLYNTGSPSNISKPFPSHFSEMFTYDNYQIKRKAHPWPYTYTNFYNTNGIGAGSYSLVEDFSKSVYICKWDSIFKFDSTAALLWTKKINTNSAAIDRNGNFFVAGDSVFKFDAAGNQLWYYPVSSTKIITDVHGNCYFRNPGNNFLTKLDSTGSQLFSGPVTVPNDFAVDTNENVYALTSPTFVKKYNVSGAGNVWSAFLPNNFDVISADKHQNCYLLGKNNVGTAQQLRYARLSTLPHPSTITCSLSDSTLCIGDSIFVYFTSLPTISNASSFAVQLSDSAGSFTGVYPPQLRIGAVSPIKVYIPTSIKESIHYKIRVTTYYYDSTVVSIPVNNVSISVPHVVTFNIAADTLCASSGLITLNASYPGGVFSGNGVSGNYFYPDSAAAGMNVLTYTLTNNCGVYSATDSVFIIPSPVVSISPLPDTVCINSALIPLGVSPIGGVLSGNGIYGSDFYPDSALAGINLITYSYNDNCGIHSVEDSIFIDAPLNITLTSLPDSICNNAMPLNLNPNIAGGVFTGQGIYNSYFYPDSAATGVNLVQYSITNTCGTFSTEDSIFVNPLPIVSFATLPDTLCFNYTPVSLNPNPVGGVFSGNGITTGVLYPDSAGIGNDTIVYVFADSNGCTNSTSQIVYIDVCLQTNDINSGSFTFYPNPFNNSLTIQTNKNESMEIILYDFTSRKIVEKSFTNNFILNTEQLAKGIYFYELRSSDGNNKSLIKTGKLIKQ